MNKKMKRRGRKQGATHLSDQVLSKVRNSDQLALCFSEEQTNRLTEYQLGLMSAGQVRPKFDDKSVDALRDYALDVDDVNSTISYLNNLKDANGIPFSRSYKDYPSISDQILRFASPDHSNFSTNPHFVVARDRMFNEFNHLNFRPLTYCCDHDIRKALPRENTHAGFLYLETGKKKKGENLEGIYNRFLDSKEIITSGDGHLGYPIMIQFRTQASGEFLDDGSYSDFCKHKTRVVSMVDMRQIVVERMFQKPIQGFMSGLPWYAGGKNDPTIGALISDRRKKYKKWISIDYSSFDQTISSWLIHTGFDAMELAFRSMTPEQQAFYRAIRSDFIYKDFVVGEGFVHSRRGVPSGSMYTQIMDTIVNKMVIDSYFHYIGRECEMTIMGDDNIIFTDIDVDMDELASYISHNFGLIIKTDDKSCMGDTRVDDPKFLSAYWTHNGKFRHPHELISRIAFPERHRKHFEKLDGGTVLTPWVILHAYKLAYPYGMSKLINVPKLEMEHPVSSREIKDLANSGFLPGHYGYNLAFT